ncbi:MAG: hypothetical protein EBZ45_06590 [Actinobacteria bacterium]|nr:hypothetical protein [Actinomycetota bacterium]
MLECPDDVRAIVDQFILDASRIDVGLIDLGQFTLVDEARAGEAERRQREDDRQDHRSRTEDDEDAVAQSDSAGKCTANETACAGEAVFRLTRFDERAGHDSRR